ncbi:MAG: hypothetical protein PHD82_05100 [Candidatus Riflebacteria bacterium]|nr:hypothetical protein [Candidatus Riflebacteria bacterium]
MKIFFKMPRQLKSSLLFTLMFCMLFPWSLMAETSYKAPKNSLSYFLENARETAEPASEEAASEPQMSDFDNDATTPVVPAPRIDRQAAIESLRAKIRANEVQEAAKISNEAEIPAPEPQIAETELVSLQVQEPVNPPKEIKTPAAPAASKIIIAKTPAKDSSSTVGNTPVEVKKAEVTTKLPAPQKEKITQTRADAPFAGVLARMQQNRAHRAAQAEKLGVILPSQGGDIATVSPSLSKIQQTIRTIVNRN